jgi:uncharacterized membrane protein YgcG
MKVGQTVAVIGAMILIAGALGFPLYEIVNRDPAMLMEAGMGPIVVLLAGLMFPVALVGFFFRKHKQAALVNVILSSAAMGIFVFISFKAPFIFRETHELPFDEAGLQFTGFMQGGVGFYLLWLGSLLALFGSLKTIGANPRYPKGTQFLRVALLWKDTIIKERVFNEGQSVTVGSDLKNMFPLPSSFAKLTLIRHKGGREDNYSIGLDKALDGRITVGDKTASVAEYKKANTANTSGTDYVAINPGDSGVFKFGELSLFFQFTEPASVKTPSSLRNFDRGMASSALLSAAIQIAFLMAIVVSPRPISVRVKSQDELRRFIKFDVKSDQKKKERQKKEDQAKKEEEEKLELEETPEEETLKEEIEDTPTVEVKLLDAGDPLKKKLDLPEKEDDFKPLKEAHIGRDAKRDSKLSKEMKKKGVIAVLDSKMKKNTSLSKLLGKDRNLAVKNVVWGPDGEYQLNNEGDNDFSYMGSSGGTGDYGGGSGFGGAGAGGGGGGFGGGGAFGMGGMGGMGGGLPGGIGGANANRSGRMALASLKGRDRKRASRVKLGSGSMGSFCKKNDVQRKVKGRSAAIRACYEMQLQMKPDLAGKVTMQWIIDLSGRVKGVKAAQNSTGNSKLDKCIGRIIGKIHFQPPKGGMCIIRWPFVFSPGV